MGLLQNLTEYFSHKADNNLSLEDTNKVITISYASAISLFFYLTFGIIALLNENYHLALVLGGGAAFIYLVYQFLLRSWKIELSSNLVLIITALVLLYCLATGGVFGTGFLWLFPYPILAVALKGLDNGTRASLIFLILITLVCYLNLLLPAFPDYELSFSLRIIGAYLSIHAIIYMYEFLQIRNQKTMQNWITESRNESKRKDDFLSKLSHQIRTPLNNITLISNLVDRSKLPPDQEDLFDTIIASTNNLIDVVNNIVQVSSIDIDDDEQNFVSFNIESTIDNTLLLFKEQHKDKIEIQSKIEAPKKNFLGNPIRIKQLILNLFENLLKVDFPDRPKIKVQINVSPENDEYGKLEFEIKCPVLKLKKDDQDNYFVAPTKPSQNKIDLQKNYLNFNIARKIVQYYNGNFDVRSKNNHTYINLALLLRNDKTHAATTETKTEQIIQPHVSQKLEDANILLVEDNSINQKIVLLSLKNKVKNIEVANNGKEALDKFGTTKYDLILMDIQMPVMNGIVATKKIRELESSTNTHTPIIAITANALSGDKESCLAAGMNEYISKPFEVESLLKKMQNLLTAKEAK
jgi:CheY-like chemotaxis protein/signal transduction histidine kinase